MKPDSPFYDHTLKELRQSELFGRLDQAVVQEMLLSFQRETWPKKSTVMHPEQTIRRFYVIISGRVKMTRVNPDTGKEFTIFLLGSGDGFDVVSLLDGKKHNVSVIAMDDIEVLTAPFDTIHSWIEGHPAFNREFLPYIGKLIRQLTNLASDLALHDTGTRLVKLFLQHTVPGNPHPRLRLIHDLSNEDLASMIGSVRAVVNRYLQKLREEGTIIARRGSLEIKDLHALVEKAESRLGLKTAKK
ncbi:MAG: Crp/Fnr family transcriptional regulator [Nitrospirota bacterium]|nr:Crp/Fnr family transcriptional regulator [Nitrospirota bacterium]